jgi:hypothetical protein
MANNFKHIIDFPLWRWIPQSPNAHAAGGGLCADKRNSKERIPFIYQVASLDIINRFNTHTKGWQPVATAAGFAANAAGSANCFAPSFSLNGSIGAGCSTTSIVTSTAMTAVGTNMFASRGASGELGFKVKIIGNSAGGSGKVEERWIKGNTSGTTPTLLLSVALSFTPASGDTYEILGGRLFHLSSGATGATQFRAMEIATNTFANHTATGQTIATNSVMEALDERYVPYSRQPGEGFIVGAGTYDAGDPKYCLTATNSANGTLTGEASAGGDYAITANRFRNFQIRIVEDTAIPTAVNQRRFIASHTGGTATAPVYTLGANWGVTPSTTAKYVIELPNLIVLRSTVHANNIATYNYSTATYNNGTTSLNTVTWSTTLFGAAGGAIGAGAVMLPAWGIEPDLAGNAKQSWVYCFRGVGAITLDCLDIAGGTNGTWENVITYDGNVMLPTTGSCGDYSPTDLEGKFGYLNIYTASVINQMYRFDVKNRVLSAFTPTSYVQAGTAAGGNRISCICAIDEADTPDTKYANVLLLGHLAAYAQEIIVQA